MSAGTAPNVLMSQEAQPEDQAIQFRVGPEKGTTLGDFEGRARSVNKQCPSTVLSIPVVG